MSEFNNAKEIMDAFLKRAGESLLEIYPSFSKEKLHPDGRPWKAPCTAGASQDCPVQGTCAFIFREDEVFNLDYWPTPFICTHRRDEGYLRVCAGWYALKRRSK